MAENAPVRRHGDYGRARRGSGVIYIPYDGPRPPDSATRTRPASFREARFTSDLDDADLVVTLEAEGYGQFRVTVSNQLVGPVDFGVPIPDEEIDDRTADAVLRRLEETLFNGTARQWDGSVLQP